MRVSDWSSDVCSSYLCGPCIRRDSEPWPPSATCTDATANRRSVNRFLTGAGYAPRMPPALPRIAAAAMLLFACGTARAATVRSAEIPGLAEALPGNVRVSLTWASPTAQDRPQGPEGGDKGV